MGVLPKLDRFISAPHRIQRLGLFALGTILVVLFLEHTFPGASVTSLHRRGDRSPSAHYQQWGDFEPMQIPGFVNTGLPGKRACDTLRYNSTVGVQQSFHLTDDIHQIALTLDHHPIVDYPDEMLNDPDMNVRDIVEKTWTRRAGSSVWLPQQKVYLSVTRVIFSPSRTVTVPKMSFLRGQVFDENWEQLNNYTLTWSGRRFKFPTVFDIPAQWVDDGSMFGPEDPRIVLEHGVEDAEPVIIFNMIGRKSEWKRAMYLYRPFTSTSTILTIKDTERAYNEANWAPFFIPEQEQQTLLGKIPITVPGYVRKPNEYIHFVHSFRPLRILKCHMHCGDCEFEYEQDVAEKTLNKHHDEAGTLRGGTNFVPVPIPSSMDLDSRVRVYAAFPQSNIAKFCDGNFYRPEFAVMVNIGRQFQLAFASESLDFGSAILELGPDDDRCEKGHILNPTTVARWDTSGSQDVMTVTFSVNDETTQVTRLHGLLGLVRNLPQFKTLFKRDGLLKNADADLVSIMSSWIGDDVRGCLLESAANFTGVKLEDATSRDEDREMDRSYELMDRLQEIKEDQARRMREELADPEIGRDYQPGIPTLEHPVDGEEPVFNPDLLGEFEDVEGLSVDGLGLSDPNKLPWGANKQDANERKKEEEEDATDERKDDNARNAFQGENAHPADDSKIELKKDRAKEDQGDMGQGKKNQDKEKEKKAENVPKAAPDHGGHHRYHKQQNRRSVWP